MSYKVSHLEEKLHRWGDYLQHFRLPAWEELPDTGLRMVEVISLVKGWLDYLPEGLREERHVTAAAINNYVRLRAMPRPKMRRYYRVHLAYILMICTLKQGLSLSMIQRLLPNDLAEEELRQRYETYAERHFRLTAEFARTGLEASLAALDKHGDESSRVLIESAAIVSSFSRLMAEKLLLLEDGNS